MKRKAVRNEFSIAVYGNVSAPIRIAVDGVDGVTDVRRGIFIAVDRAVEDVVGDAVTVAVEEQNRFIKFI